MELAIISASHGSGPRSAVSLSPRQWVCRQVCKFTLAAQSESLAPRRLAVCTGALEVTQHLACLCEQQGGRGGHAPSKHARGVGNVWACDGGHKQERANQRLVLANGCCVAGLGVSGVIAYVCQLASGGICCRAMLSNHSNTGQTTVVINGYRRLHRPFCGQYAPKLSNVLGTIHNLRHSN
eukprot:2441264-Pleurochrysis_carterae.AAC.2